MMLRRSLWTLVLGIIAMGTPFQEIHGANTKSSPVISPTPPDEVTVSAAISLKDALDEISHLYSTEHPSAEVHFNLGGSGTLQRQIEQGAPVDIFISASPKEMDSLQSQGLLLPGTRKDLARNSVVLIVPAGSTSISGFQDLTKAVVKTVAVGEPQTVPAGKVRAGSTHASGDIRPIEAETRARKRRSPSAHLRRDGKRRRRNRVCHRREDIEEGDRGSDSSRGLAFACRVPGGADQEFQERGRCEDVPGISRRRKSAGSFSEVWLYSSWKLRRSNERPDN